MALSITDNLHKEIEIIVQQIDFFGKINTHFTKGIR